jgi:hypothetical protein
VGRARSQSLQWAPGLAWFKPGARASPAKGVENIMRVFTIILGASLVSVSLPACNAGESPEPEFVEAYSPIPTELGWFMLELVPTHADAWPKYAGPTELAIHIDAGPDPLPPDPEFSGAGADYLPPLTLTFGQAHLWEGPGGPENLTAAPRPVKQDGSQWMTVFNFTSRGNWIVPVTITDAADRSDTVQLVFHIE